MNAVIKSTKDKCRQCKNRDAVIVEQNHFYYCAECKLKEIRRINGNKKTLPRSRAV